VLTTALRESRFDEGN